MQPSFCISAEFSGRVAFRGAFSAMPILKELEMFYAGALRALLVIGKPTGTSAASVNSSATRSSSGTGGATGVLVEADLTAFLPIFEMSRMTIDDDKDRCLVVVNALVVDAVVVIPIAVVAYAAIVDVAEREMSGLRNDERQNEPIQCRIDSGLLSPVTPTDLQPSP